MPSALVFLSPCSMSCQSLSERRRVPVTTVFVSLFCFECCRWGYNFVYTGFVPSRDPNIRISTSCACLIINSCGPFGLDSSLLHHSNNRAPIFMLPSSQNFTSCHKLRFSNNTLSTFISTRRPVLDNTYISALLHILLKLDLKTQFRIWLEWQY